LVPFSYAGGVEKEARNCLGVLWSAAMRLASNCAESVESLF
jgi:hypothetical protein